MAGLPLIVFDGAIGFFSASPIHSTVNETLLDLATLDPTFERIFGDKDAMRTWPSRW